MNLKRKLHPFPGYRDEAGGAGGGAGGGTDEGGGGEFDWRSQLPESISGNEEAMTTLKSFNTYEDLVNGVIGSQRMLGSRIPIPSENADEATRAEFVEKLAKVPGVITMPNEDDADSMANFYSKLGRPATAEEYQFEKPPKDSGLQFNEDQDKWFRDQAHKLGLTQKQAAGLNDSWNEMQAAALAQQQQDIAAGKAALEKKWGAGLDQNMGIAKAAIKQFGGEELATQLDDVVKTAPEIAELFFNVGKATLEDSQIQKLSGGETMRTIQEIEQDRAEAMRDPAFQDLRDPNHQMAVDRVTKLAMELDKVKRAS